MRLILPLILLVCSCLPAVAQANALKGNPSPYLALHGDDPVHWQPWSADILSQARAQGRMIFISSGYYACHWCHVMQRESFKDPAVARLLNDHFIAVKLDRELNPALDAHLIDFVERTSGISGWPLNVFLTPEGYPLVGLTYAPRDNFVELLGHIEALWRTQPSKARQLAEQGMAEIVRQRAGIAQAKTLPAPALVAALRREALSQANEVEGGFGEQSRFPMAPQLLALLQGLRIEPNAELQEFLITTLDQMAHNGLRDHLAGGFFRYTTDPSWQVPHFEKMLYDQALMALLYLRAGQQLDQPEYLAVAADTLDFVLRDMAGKDGGYIASLSAVDAAGEEGGAYLWTPAQLKAVLHGEQLDLARDHWRLHGFPATTGGFLPMTGTPVAQLADAAERPRVKRLLADARRKLLAARAKRGIPRDDKQLAGWNGLLLQALAEASQVLPQARYGEAAKRLQGFLTQRLWHGQRLARALDAGNAIGRAGLADYAYVVGGLAAMGEKRVSAQLLAQAWQRFHTAIGWQRTDQGLLPGMAVDVALMDDVLPSPSAQLIGLSLAAGEPALARQAVKARAAAAGRVAASPFWYASHALLLAGQPGVAQR
jgi:uncharacterized protein YyaL (SSP411 family)